MRRCLVTLLLISLPLTAALADVYRSVDAQGHVQYSDTPTPGAVLVSSADVSSDSGPADASSEASAAAKNAARLQKEGQEARSAYEQSVAARHLYKLDASGQRHYLTDAEADQQRVQYRLAMQTACQDQNSP
jgi:Domain of unknown function (DUF4124)